MNAYDKIKSNQPLLLPEIDTVEFSECIINTHGNDEWQKGLFTYQLHGHWGIYSLLGVKMGLYAKELSLFSGPVDQVVSYAGSQPPLSCLNDGLQVSTGATLGNGKIQIAKSSGPVKAQFQFSHHCFTLILKKSLQKKLEHDLQKIKASNDGIKYWKAIEQQSMVYWLNWNRKTIFNLAFQTSNNDN